MVLRERVCRGGREDGSLTYLSGLAVSYQGLFDCIDIVKRAYINSVFIL